MQVYRRNMPLEAEAGKPEGVPATLKGGAGKRLRGLAGKPLEVEGGSWQGTGAPSAGIFTMRIQVNRRLASRLEPGSQTCLEDGYARCAAPPETSLNLVGEA